MSRTVCRTQSARDKSKDRRLQTLYRITLEERKKIEAFQKASSVYRILVGKNPGTDHDHNTGLIRGLLDWRINRAYGLLEKACPDSLSDMLRSLATYHESPPAVLALGEKRYGLIGLAKYKKKMVYGPPATKAKKRKR